MSVEALGHIVSENGRTNRRRHDESRPMKDRFRAAFRDKTLVGIVAFGLLVVGCVGIFVNASDIGSTAAIVAGAVMFAVATLVDRILMIKYGPYEIHLAKDYLEAAEIADEEGDERSAEALRSEGLTLLRAAEEAHTTYASAIRKLYGLARADTENAIRQALEAEGLAVEPGGLHSLLTYFSIVGIRDDEKVGVVISFGEWDIESAAQKITLSMHSTPGLKGVVVVQNMLSSRRRLNQLPQPSISDVERNIENQLQPGMKVRIVFWRQGDPIDGIRRAIAEVMN